MRTMPMVLGFAVTALLPAAPPARGEDATSEFSVSKAPWLMALPMDGMRVDDHKIRPNGQSAYVLMSNASSGLTVSFFIEPADKCSSGIDCRDQLWNAMKPRMEHPESAELSRIGDAPTLEFLIPALGRVPIRQQNVYAEFVVDGYWVDFHLSKGDYKPEDRALFVDFIQSVSFSQKP